MSEVLYQLISLVPRPSVREFTEGLGTRLSIDILTNSGVQILPPNILSINNFRRIKCHMNGAVYSSHITIKAPH